MNFFLRLQVIVFLIAVTFISYSTSVIYCADEKDVLEIKRLLKSGYENIKTGNLNLDIAIKSFNKVISLDNKNINAYAGLGMVYLWKNNPDKAIECFNKAISLGDEDSNTYVILGDSYIQKNNPDKAMECYNKAISINNKDAMAYFRIGSLYLSLNKVDDALKAYNTLKKLDMRLADKLEKRMKASNNLSKPDKK